MDPTNGITQQKEIAEESSVKLQEGKKSSKDRGAMLELNNGKCADKSTRGVQHDMNEDADFVENVMKQNISSIQIKDFENEKMVKTPKQLTVTERAAEVE